MTKEEKAIKKGKKIECSLDFFFLIPPVLGVLAFVMCLFDNDGAFARMRDLSANWTCDYSGEGGGGMSAAPIYLGFMALVGAYLIKDSIKYFFMGEEETKSPIASNSEQ